MPQITTTYQPGSASTVTDAGPGPGGPSELENFYRALLAKQSQQAQAQQAAAARPRPQATPAYQPQYEQQPVMQQASALSEAERGDRLNEIAYRQRLREIDLNPPKKYIESRPGIIGGYADDVTMLPISMRPANAAIGYGPQNEAKARGGLADDQAFNAKIDADRARTQNTNLPSNNSYYGRQ